MRSCLATCFTACFLVVTLLGTGCSEAPANRVSVLEDQNRTLTAEAERLRAENVGLQRERDLCQNDLTATQRSNDNLRKLAQEPSPSPAASGEATRVRGPAAVDPKVIALEGGMLPDPFPAGKVNLKPESRAALDRLAAEIQAKYADRDIYVFGHTDTDTIKKSQWLDNRELSTERALAVVRYLESHGVDPKHLVACGWGDQQPLESNSSKEGKAKNRRVEICVAENSAPAARP
jgi:chemotaxis protein MotB